MFVSLSRLRHKVITVITHSDKSLRYDGFTCSAIRCGSPKKPDRGELCRAASCHHVISLRAALKARKSSNVTVLCK